MLDAEEGRARLAALARPDWPAAATRRIRRLHRRHRGPAGLLLAPTPSRPASERVRADFDRRLDEAAAALDELPAADLAELMTALHPGLGAALARWWVDAQGQPYQAGPHRCGFRAPHDPAASRSLRCDTLRRTLTYVGPYDADPVWLAAWAPHLGRELTGWGDSFPGGYAGPLLAAAIDAGGPAGDAVLTTLIRVGNGEHPVGRMDRHVIVGLLRQGRPEGWEYVERLLLAAQRQEGLRQSILEAADEAHPRAFDRIIDLVLRHDLLRFAAAVRAAGLWVGWSADVTETATLTRRLEQLRRLRVDPGGCREALGGDAWSVYLALVALAGHDVQAALVAAGEAIARPDREVRAAVGTFLSAARLPAASGGLFRLLDDPNLGVAALVYWTLQYRFEATDFDALERLARRLPERDRTTEPIGLYGEPMRLSRSAVVGTLLSARGDRPLAVLLPWLPAMDANARQKLASVAGEQPSLTPDVRAALVRLVGDRSSWVRAEAVTAMDRLGIAPAEAPELEALLTRQGGDLRRAVIGLLARQPAAAAVRSAERLWGTGHPAQRDAACELLGAVGRRSKPAVAAARAFAAARLTADQRRLLAGLVDPVDWPAPAAGSGVDSDSAGDAVDGTRAAGAPAGPGVSGRSDLDGGPTAPTGADAGPAGAADLDGPAGAAELDGPAGAAELARLAGDPGLGLFDPAGRVPVPRPVAVRRKGGFGSPVATRIVAALDDLAAAHRDTVVTVTNWQGAREVLLGDAGYLPTPYRTEPGSADPGRAAAEPPGLVLPEVFRGWWARRPVRLRDDDPLDALRALVTVLAETDLAGSYWRERHPWWHRQLRSMVGERRGELRHPEVVRHALAWLLADCVTGAVLDECLDAVETTLAAVPRSVLSRSTGRQGVTATVSGDWRYLLDQHPWAGLLTDLFRGRPELFDPARIARWYRLARWLDDARPDGRRVPVAPPLLLAAYEAGAATDDDVLDQLLYPYGQLLGQLTRHRRAPQEQRHPRAVALADRVRDRVLAIERVRGELVTPASQPALNVASVAGAASTVDLLVRLGRGSLQRGWLGGNLSREAVYSHLIRVSYPAPADTAETLRVAAAAAKLRDTRLVELAVYAPQWAALVQDCLGWPGLADAVWWYHAHTKDDQWSVLDEVRETWAALSAERTPLSAADLLAGAVDVDWFWRCRSALTGPRWAALHAAAKLAAHGSGHRRAQLFAEAMLGEIAEAELVTRITERRHQDSVRALGLLPLPADRAERDAAVGRRYRLLREFERGAAKFGSQRQASERTAVRIGVENLARATGAVDPQRFIWATEAAEAGELADGPVSVTADGVTVTLSVTADGEPELAVRRGERALRSVPGAVRKEPAVVALQQWKTALARQATRVRAALEAAMVGQDPFTAEDLVGLDRHPVVAPLLRLLLFVDPDGLLLRRDAGGGFVDLAGTPVEVTGPVRLAHPVDLLASGDWVAWQERYFAEQRRQPIKQVFRELYVLTVAERATSPLSHRYEGHQVQPRQALALFQRRGWLADRGSGEVSRVFHQHGLVARVEFVDGVLTPAEVELPTLHVVGFTRRGDYLAQPIETVPPVVFAETMRDLDLVVSVAHAGGVDPEATASTVDMRAALVRETARLLALDNVRLLDAHVLIDGALGEYSVHLGSGVVHRRPGGAVCLIPVDSQRRGRVFLPFADDDPKTAEVVAKVLLLARDKQIKDPTILEQLRS